MLKEFFVLASLVATSTAFAAAAPSESDRDQTVGAAVLREEAAGAASVLPAADTVTLQIEGMTCGGCVLAVRKVLTDLKGVSKAEVTYEGKRAIVTYDASKVTAEQMIAAIKTLKYTATVVVPEPRA